MKICAKTNICRWKFEFHNFAPSFQMISVFPSLSQPCHSFHILVIVAFISIILSFFTTMSNHTANPQSTIVEKEVKVEALQPIPDYQKLTFPAKSSYLMEKEDDHCKVGDDIMKGVFAHMSSCGGYKNCLVYGKKTPFLQNAWNSIFEVQGQCNL